MLIGCMYRSPNTSSEENNEKLFQLLKSSKMLQYSRICIVGDFNYPYVCWDGRWSGPRNNDVIQHVHDAFLIQKVVKPTRRRINQNPTLDDWVLVNNDDLISDIVHLDPVGKSDHDTLLFQFNFSKDVVKPPESFNYNLKQGDYSKMRKIINEQNWQSMLDMNVEESWCFMKDNDSNSSY